MPLQLIDNEGTALNSHPSTPDPSHPSHLSHLPLPAFLADPEPSPTPVNGALLLDDLAAFLTRHVILPEFAADALALWCLHTYAFEARDISTYIGVESPEKRCGKTTLLNVLGRLVRRPVAAANISSPAFFRVIAETQPTLLIDEALDLVRHHTELRGILNAGYHRESAYVLRATGARTFLSAATSDPSATGVPPQPSLTLPASSVGRAYPRASSSPSPTSTLERFSCWCPKLICITGRLPEALADRCILIRMQRKQSTEPCERLPHSRVATEEIRSRCLRFATDHSQSLATAAPAFPSELHDRAADIWEPLLSLADLAGGSWPERARAAAVGLTQTAADSSGPIQLVLDCFLCFEDPNPDQLLTADLLLKLNRYRGRPWFEALKGKPMSAAWLAAQLRPYGIRPSAYREGDHVRRGYTAADFSDAIRRYLPESEFDNLAPRPAPTQQSLKKRALLDMYAPFLKSQTNSPPGGTDDVMSQLRNTILKSFGTDSSPAVLPGESCNPAKNQ